VAAGALVLLLAAALGASAQAPPFDSSGNGLLKGTYYFREAIYLVGDQSGTLSRALAAYGNITFDGAGTYTISAQPILDSNAGAIASLTTTGSYSIAASGYGFIASPVSSGDYVYGLVSKGIFVGSSTESSFNDLFVAAPLASPPPTNASFRGGYTMNYYAPDPSIQYLADATFQMNPDGNGGLGDISLSGYFAGGGSVAYNQTAKSVRYSFSNGGCAVFFPQNVTGNYFIAETEYLYFSPDGNFVFGGSPTDYDFIIGVRNAAAGSTQTLNGLFYEGGINLDASLLGSGGFVSLDTWYGSFNTTGGSSISHERFNNPFYPNAISSTFSGTVPASISGSYTDNPANRKYTMSPDGSIRIGLGIGPFLGITVAMQAPTFTGPSVYLNPTGVINSASFAPFTAGVSGGEFITLYGSGLAASTVVASTLPFPPTLGGVQVLINGTAAPLYYVSSGQIAAIVPYSITGSVAAIQVINQGVPSNAVTELIASTTPGMFSLGANGLGYAAVEHGDGSVVTVAKPATVGETVAAFMTGLGPVSPAVPEGSAGPVSPLSQTTLVLSAYVNGVSAKIEYAGLAPYLAGLYQVNFDVPTGAVQGDNTVEIDDPDSFAVQTLIPVSTGVAGLAIPETAASPAATAGRGPRTSKPVLRTQLPHLNAPTK
jgi:uncharacterized protein (TIGR03437 family)